MWLSVVRRQDSGPGVRDENALLRDCKAIALLGTAWYSRHDIGRDWNACCVRRIWRQHYGLNCYPMRELVDWIELTDGLTWLALVMVVSVQW